MEQLSVIVLQTVFSFHCHILWAGGNVTIDQICEKTLKSWSRAQFFKPMAHGPEDFGRHAPYKSDNLTPESANAMLQNYRNQIAAKRKLEAEFRPKQELFGIEPANYKELEWVEQEIEKLTMVWDIRDGWNKEWDKLRSGSFQSLKLILNCQTLFMAR